MFLLFCHASREIRKGEKKRNIPPKLNEIKQLIYVHGLLAVQLCSHLCSPVSKPIFMRTFSCCSTFQFIHVLRNLAPLHTQTITNRENSVEKSTIALEFTHNFYMKSAEVGQIPPHFKKSARLFCRLQQNAAKFIFNSVPIQPKRSQTLLIC